MPTEVKILETRPDDRSGAIGRHAGTAPAMKGVRLSLVAAALGLSLLPLMARNALAEDKPVPPHVAAADQKPATTPVDYRPPDRGAPESRVAGSTRGFGAG